MIETVCVVIVTTVVGLALLEFLSRVFLMRFASEPHFAKYASFAQLQKRYTPMMTPHNYLGYFPTPNYVRGKNRHNTLGYRGEEFPVQKPVGEYRIVCLGASTTYTLYVPDFRNSYPARLQHHLAQAGFDHVRVINGGATLWTSWETLVSFLFRVLDLEPDLVIVNHAMADIHTRLVWPPEAYRGDNSGMKPAAQATFLPLVEHSTLIRTFLVHTGRTPTHNGFQRMMAKDSTYHAREFEVQKARGTYPSGIFEEASAEQMLETNKPIYFRRNLESLIAVAKRRGIDVVLSSYAISTLFEREPRVTSTEYINSIREMNSVLLEIARENDVNFFDLAGQMPDDTELFTDGRHVTAAGADMKAQLFSSFLIEEEIVPRGTSLQNVDSGSDVLR